MAPATCKLRKIPFCPQINLSNLQPADEEYELEDEENWEEDFRLRVELLVTNQRENEVRICRHVHDLLTNIRYIFQEKDSLQLPDCRLEVPGCDRSPPQSPNLP